MKWNFFFAQYPFLNKTKWFRPNIFWIKRLWPSHVSVPLTWHINSPLQHIALQDHCFTHLHVDMVGPLHSSQQACSHLLTIICTCRSSRWIEAIPKVSTSAQSCAESIIEGWIACFEVHTLITLDMERSSLWLCGLSHVRAGHPAQTLHSLPSAVQSRVEPLLTCHGSLYSSATRLKKVQGAQPSSWCKASPYFCQAS